MILSLQIMLISFVVLRSHICRATSSTSNLLFGIPNHQDCVNAFNQIPYALSPTHFGAQGYRLFSEPQFLLPPFKGVNNRYRPKAIVQLPKLWRYSMITQKRRSMSRATSNGISSLPDSCRIAFMSYGSHGHYSVRNALFGATWSSVVAQMAPIVAVTDPRTQQRPCGGWAPYICTLVF